MGPLCRTCAAALLVGIVPTGSVQSQTAPDSTAAEPLLRRVAAWEEQYGNHRILLKLDAPAEAVAVRVDWRRPGRRIANKNLLVMHLDSKRVIDNRVVLKSNRECGELIFDGSAGAGNYAIYTHQPLPTVEALRAEIKTKGAARKGRKKTGTRAFGFSRAELRGSFPLVRYRPPEQKASPQWLKQQGLDTAKGRRARFGTLPRARVVGYEALAIPGKPETYARNLFDEMETIATAAEHKALVSSLDADAGFALFPEDREHPVKMTRDLPLRWIQKGPGNRFADSARPGEFLTFQVGVFALAQLDGLKVQISDLTGAGTTIPASEATCFNNGGIDWTGKPFAKTVSVKPGHVQAMWCGVRIPPEAPAGVYKGTAAVSAKGFPPRDVTLEIAVDGAPLADGGDRDLSNLTRLRWLNSTRGIGDDPVAPFTPLKRQGATVSLLGRTIELGNSGLPKQVTSFIDLYDIVETGRSLMSQPAAITLTRESRPVAWTSRPLAYGAESAGAIHFASEQKADGLRMAGEGKLEADGYIRYRYTIEAEAPVTLENVSLDLPLDRETAKYVAGCLSRNAGLRPASADVPMKGGLMYQAFWSGDYNVGLGCILKNHDDEWNAENKTKKIEPLVPSWMNGGAGFYRIREAGGAALISVNTGAVKLKPGAPLELNFALLATPFKPIRRERWGYRMFHLHPGHDPDLDEAAAGKAQVVNLHHGASWNRHINYPFVNEDGLAEFAKRADDKGIAVKLYNTVRELSTRAAELWPLWSLGDEIIVRDEGFETLDQKPAMTMRTNFVRTGNPWICEHLRDGYRNRWHTNVHESDQPELDRLVGRQQDSSISVQGLSRWHNYYIEGLNWLRKQTGVRGIYLDGIGYDRGIMKRARKAMTIDGLPAPQIDFHGAVHHAWLQHAPYVDNIWFGEGARYKEGPAYWLVEVSGIPFGITGEILGGASDRNQHRGMLYGMSRRLRWGGNEDTTALWGLWDSFGIAEARWIGYWDSRSPARTDHPDVPVTVYQRPGKSLIALASWAGKDISVTLTVDWAALGLDPAKVTLRAPKLDRMQEAAEFAPDDSLPIPHEAGLILIAEER